MYIACIVFDIDKIWNIPPEWQYQSTPGNIPVYRLDTVPIMVNEPMISLRLSLLYNFSASGDEENSPLQRAQTPPYINPNNNDIVSAGSHPGIIDYRGSTLGITIDHPITKNESLCYPLSIYGMKMRTKRKRIRMMMSRWTD